MKHCVLILVAGLVVAPVLADSGPLSVRGVRHASYDLIDGQIMPDGVQTRFGDMVWGTTRRSGTYVPAIFVLDWGDISDGQIIGGFSFAYATDLVLPERLTTVLWFYAEENGCDTPDPVPLAGFWVSDLPTGDPDGTFNSWTITIDLEPDLLFFTITGSDLDGDDLTDFGYSYWFTDHTPGAVIGPLIADADPNDDPFPAPGIEDGWWIGPNCVMSPYGGDPFAQTYLLLYGPDANDGDCASPGASGKWCSADIDSGGYPGDCIVDLADLAQLLSNYGMTSGATWGDGDVDPLQPDGGDGDVDLGDLAELLSQYGDDCN
jgi:hypothetical protein